MPEVKEAGPELQARMTSSDFVQRALGAPWVKWRADFGGMDCWGCVDLYHREVLGITIPVPRAAGDVHGFEEWAGWAEHWEELPGPEAGATWMAWRDGVPKHCGVMLDPSKALHAEANEVTGAGSVRVHRLAALERIYGRVRFYRYAPH